MSRPLPRLPPEPPADPHDALPTEGWSRCVRALLDRHRLPATDLAPFDSGSDVVWGTREHVVKLTPPRWLDQVRHEREVLEALEGRLSPRTPAVVATGDQDGWPYTVMTRLPGEPLGQVWSRADEAARRRLALRLGALLEELRSLCLPMWGDDVAFLADVRANLAERQRALGASEDQIADALGILATWAPRDADPVFLHTELLGDHVLVAEGELVGLIDLADARTGHPDYDLVALAEFVFRGEPGMMAACLEGAGQADGPEVRRALVGWALLHRFANLPRMLRFAGAETVPRALQRLYGPGAV